jgi:hypothetical protein
VLSEIFSTSIKILIIKVLNASAILLVAFVYDKNEYGNFAIFYSIATGIAALLQSGLFELAANKNSTNGRSDWSKLKIIKEVLSFTVIFAWTLFGIGIFEIFYFKNKLLAISTFAISLGSIIAVGNSLSGIYRMIGEDSSAIKVLMISNLGPPLGFIIGSKFIESTVFAGVSSIIIGLILLHLFCEKVSSSVKIVHLVVLSKRLKSNKVFFDYLIVSVFGWLAGYGMSLVAAILTEKTIAAEYFMIYTIAASAGMVAAAINNAWAPIYMSQSTQGLLDEVDKIGKLYRFELIILTLYSIFLIGVVRVLAEIYTHNSLSVISNNLIEFSLMLSSVSLGVPWWVYQNHYTINGASTKYRENVTKIGLCGIVVWQFCILILGGLGLYVGFFVNAFLKMFLFVEVSKKIFLVNSYIKESMFSAMIIVAVGCVFSQ